MNSPFPLTFPCLVLAVGTQAERIALDAQTLYLRGNPWRSAAARFLALRFSQAVGEVRASCSPLKAVCARKTNAITRQQTYSATLRAANELRASLETALHDLRAHEQTLLAGLGQKRAFSLQVLLLADLTGPESAAVFPLATLLEALLAHEADKQMLLLLNVAQFSSGKEARLGNAYCRAGLQNLELLFAPESNAFRDSLARDLELPGPAFPPTFSIFLFDRYKEGGWEVKDESELRLLNANFLLALLIDGLAARPEKLAYHSAAATALVYNPEGLIEACAVRAGLEFLQREFGEQALPEARILQQVTSETGAIYGDTSTGSVHSLRGWLDAVTSGTPFNPRPGETPGLEIHFADLNFENLPVEEWSYAIQGYDTHFGTAQFPGALEKLKANAQAQLERLSQEQADWLETLPRQARLYPGGLAASHQVIAELHEKLRQRRQQFLDWEAETFSPENLARKVELALQRLDQAVALLPQPPRWFSFLPFSLPRLAKNLFTLLFLHQEHARLALLRQQAVLALELKYAASLEKEAREAFGALCQRLDAELQEMDQAIQAFQTEVQKAHQHLEKQSRSEIEASIFRQSVVDQAVMEWACAEFKKPDDEIRFRLFDEQDFLYYWRDIDWRNLEAGLLTYARGMYQPLLTYSLDQLLAHRADPELAPIWTALSQGAMPLLQPDYDLTGGGQTFQAQYFLCASSRSTSFASFLRQPLSAWEALATGDPTLNMCVSMRHLIPPAALGQLWARGQADFEKLSETERRGLQLFAAETEQPEERRK